MSKKRICFIAQFPPPIHGLSKAVDTLYNSELSKEFDFLKVDITNNKKILKNIFRLMFTKADLFYFTISQTKGGNLRDIIILKLLELQHKKCLIHLHGGYYRQLVDHDLPKWQRKVNYKLINNLEGAIVLGPSLKYIFQGMISEDKIFTVPNCIDDEFLLSSDELEKKISEYSDKDVKHVLYLSNFIKSKGYPEVLELAKLEKERVDLGGVKQLHFDFAGKFFNQEDEKYFKAFIQDNGLKEYITYHGVVTGDKKNNLLKKSDIFVLLTRYPKEGQPISILEAMGNGMVIVTTNHAGIPDIVSEPNLIISKEDIKKISEIIHQRNFKKCISVNYTNILNSFTEINYINNMKKVFKTV